MVKVTSSSKFEGGVQIPDVPGASISQDITLYGLPCVGFTKFSEYQLANIKPYNQCGVWVV